MPPKKGYKARAKANARAEKKQSEAEVTTETKVIEPPPKRPRTEKPVFRSIISTRAAARKSAIGPPIAAACAKEVEAISKVPVRKSTPPKEVTSELVCTRRASSRRAPVTKDAPPTTEPPTRKSTPGKAKRPAAKAPKETPRGADERNEPPKKATTKAAVPQDNVIPTADPKQGGKKGACMNITIQVPQITKRAASTIPSRIVKKPRSETFRFVNDENDPIIENLIHLPQRSSQVCPIDGELLDHVALEGLEGITFKRLCLVLDAVIPSLNSCKDDSSQAYIWSIIAGRYLRRVRGAQLQIFYLDPSLAESTIHNSSQNSAQKSETLNETSDHPVPKRRDFYIDRSIKLPEQSLKWLGRADWKLHPVQDGTVMGSCPHYMSRLNISDEITVLFDLHGPRDSLLAVHEKYDLKNVYFVADQELRRRAILPMTSDPNMDIKLREYACLELIGKTRCYGIVFPNDKTLGRYRILLTKKNLISQFQQTCNTFIVHHIRRFTQFSVGMMAIKAFKGVSGANQVKSKLKINGDDEDDDTAEGDDAMRRLNPATAIRDTCCHPKNLKSNRDMLKMVYDVIASSNGRSMCDIRRKLKIPKHHARNHLKNLANIELIGSHTKIVGDKKLRIYRARHRSNRRLNARQKKYSKGSRSKWDSIDIQARDLLGNRRSQFSQAEDSLLILCRIAGLLLQPNLGKLSFVVSKETIRDILHEELLESHDKTSDSLLRRTKFLRRIPSNLMLINELTAELREDPDIVRLVGIKQEAGSRTGTKLIKLFKQVLRAIRAKLPHLLGLTSSLLTGGNGASLTGGSIAKRASVSINNAAATTCSKPLEFATLDDLTSQFELIDCQVESSSSSTIGAHTSTQVASYHQPSSTLVQLAESIQRDYRLEISKCSGMPTIMLLSSCCVQTEFNLDLRLKVPVRVVGLDQDSENFKEMFEHAKGSKETSRLIANLTTPNPTADSRRALFMLRNALKLETIDKCGKLADALVVQPCDITFSSSSNEQEMTLDKVELVRNFLARSGFINEFFDKDKSLEESLLRMSGGNKKRRRQAAVSDPAGSEQQQERQEGDAQALDRRQRVTRRQSSEPRASTSSAPSEAPQVRVNPKATEEIDLKFEMLLEMIESVMCWISVMPGIEFKVLQGRLRPRLNKRNDDHLNELLDLMLGLELISRQEDRLCEQLSDEEAHLGYLEPRLFGYEEVTGDKIIVTFAPSRIAHVRYCQLIGLDLLAA